MQSWLIRLGLIGLVVAGGFVFRDRLSGHVTELQVGDCFDLPAGTATEFEDVQHHPCTEPHDYEAFAELTYPAPDEALYPGDIPLGRWADAGCASSFDDYVGMPFERSTLTFYVMTPSTDGWEKGDRVVNCVLATGSATKLTVSLKGSRR
jgi:Septum formation